MQGEKIAKYVSLWFFSERKDRNKYEKAEIYMRTAKLIQDNQSASKALMAHLQQILPSIAFYEALLKEEGSQEKALALYEKWCSLKIEKIADMTVCPYVETCKKYGCPELAQFFCKSDDICYGNMHPKLVWGRTKTLGTGGDCCDFSLWIKEE